MTSARDNERVVDELAEGLEAHLRAKDDVDSPISHSDFEVNRQATTTGINCATTEESKECDDSDSDEDSDVHAKDADVDRSQEEKEASRVTAERYKIEGNELFKLGEYERSIDLYTRALRTCSLLYAKDRAVLYSNRAASKMKLERNKEAIKDCTRAIELDPTYIKAHFRRAQCYELTESLDESFADFKKTLELDPQHVEAKKAITRLPPLIEERNEKLKTEMMSKLKDLGNLVLKPFGLSTENFKLTQDPDTKGYSINFQQNK